MPGTGPVSGVTGEQLNRRQWATAFALITSLFFVWGFAYGLLDVLNSHFQVIFGISKTQSTLLQFAYFGSYFFFSPFAGRFMHKYGYKKGIHVGLTLYSLGAIFFWPSAVYKKYGGFVACTAVMGSGLCTLEVAANSYITVLGSPKYAAARLNFSQAFNGVASFTGPLIASRWFFTGKNATTLDTVQWVYLAVAGLGAALNIFFYFTYLPEITEEALTEEMRQKGLLNQDQGPFWKQHRCTLGFVAQMCYCGAQVGVASMVVNYLTEQGIGVDHSEASRLFSYCQMTFTAGRFVGVVLLRFFDPALVLSFFAVACFSFCTSVALLPGWSGPACLFALFFFESISYPCIFTIATKNLGRHTKQGSSLIVQGVGGGAWYPPAQGHVADTISSRRSYLVPMTGYIVVSAYAIGMVIWQTLHGGFRLWTQEETAETVGIVVGPADLDDRKEHSVDRDSSDNEKANEVRNEMI